jgi:hypothetical protein
MRNTPADILERQTPSDSDGYRWELLGLLWVAFHQITEKGGYF